MLLLCTPKMLYSSVSLDLRKRGDYFAFPKRDRKSFESPGSLSMTRAKIISETGSYLELDVLTQSFCLPSPNFTGVEKPDICHEFFAPFFWVFWVQKWSNVGEIYKKLGQRLLLIYIHSNFYVVRPIWKDGATIPPSEERDGKFVEPLITRQSIGWLVHNGCAVVMHLLNL